MFCGKRSKLVNRNRDGSVSQCLDLGKEKAAAWPRLLRQDKSGLLLKRCGVEFVPVVEIVEIDGVAEGACVVLKAAGSENALASRIVMVVTANRGVEFLDIGLVQLRSRLLSDPVFELDVGGAIGLDVIDGFLAIEAKPIQNHLVVALAATGIAGG